jgi:Rieske Fe-S protein
MPAVNHEPCDDHAECAIDDSRRAFLRHGLLAVAALTAVAGGAAPLHAMARTYATGLAQGDTLTYPIPAEDGAMIDGRNKVILVRFQGAVSAFSLECPHRQTTLEWQPANARFYCPKHKSTFKPEGTLIGGKAERNMDRYAVRLEGTNVVVDRSALIKSSVDAAAWAAATVKVD